jgi:hypothetical protein
MIYNYATKNPVQISQQAANVLFPGFNFGNNMDLFFTFPNDGVVYNYTTNTFYEGGNQYHFNALPVNQLGQYIGFTQKVVTQLPTLYYTNGRLTLQHRNCRNIGWHPRKNTIAGQPVNYVYGNVLNPNDFPNDGDFDLAEFNQAKQAALANIANSTLLELYYNNNNKIVGRHPSRSYLRQGMPGNGFVFNPNAAFLAVNETNPNAF